MSQIMGSEIVINPSSDKDRNVNLAWMVGSEHIIRIYEVVWKDATQRYQATFNYNNTPFSWRNEDAAEPRVNLSAEINRRIFESLDEAMSYFFQQPSVIARNIKCVSILEDLTKQ